MKKIKFIHPVPSFIWKDMKVYGPFDVGEELEIYPEVADLIIRKGRAKEIKVINAFAKWEKKNETK